MTQPGSNPSSGLVLIDKPGGITSHDVVAKLRKALKTRRVGHAGTLDPMATGLLVLGVNSGTKLLNYLTGADKTYLATIRLGWATSTDDAEGERIDSAPGAAATIAPITKDEIHTQLKTFSGKQLQVPSSVSAIRVSGQRAYDLVRSGLEVQLEPRPVEIYEIQLLSDPRFEAELGAIDLDVRVSCSSGTYIRAIARDLGERLAVGGHLIALRRTKVGPFDIQAAATLAEPMMISLAEAAAQFLPVREVTQGEVAELRLGRRLLGDNTFYSGAKVAAVDKNQELIAVLEASPEALQPRWVVTER